MVRQYEVVEKATSVKEIRIIAEPKANAPGCADFAYRPVYSVFDYGTIQEAVPLDNSTVNMMAAYNFKLLDREGVPTHFMGLVDRKMGLVNLRDALRAGNPADAMRVQMVNRLMPEFEEGVWDYSAFTNPEANNYMLPLELITRNALGKSSSVWKRVKRGEITMQDLGLPQDFTPGDQIPSELRPVLDYSTKFEPEDRYISADQARILAGLSEQEFAELNNIVTRASNLMTAHAEARGFVREDGKVEVAVKVTPDGKKQFYLADAVCTWHEDRLSWNGLGISKQRIRDEQIAFNPQWYAEVQRAKDQAKQNGVEDFRTLIDPAIERKPLREEFLHAANRLFQAGTNQWIDHQLYQPFAGSRDPLEDQLSRAAQEFEAVRTKRTS